jgi:dihydrofolate reductase
MRLRLLVVSTADGFIARAPGHAPSEWASEEEQILFFGAVAAADWAILGRGTHEAAPRPDRHRIVFSRSVTAPEWRTPTQVWVNPEGLDVGDLARLVAGRRALRDGLILGGTAVHDWFHARGHIDEVTLTIEPVTFGEGVPIFGDQTARDPVEALLEKGYAPVGERRLNAVGTRLLTFASVFERGSAQPRRMAN